MTLRAHLLVFGGAALYALALPPFDLAPAAWLALAPLAILAHRLRPREALLLGAVAGFYTSWTVTWWLPQAVASYFDASLLRGAATISTAYVVAVSTMFGAFAWTASRLRPLPPVVRLVGLAAAWTALELVRARGLDDPWALLGYTQYRQLGLLQIATVTGVYGVSFLVALVNVAVATLVTERGSTAAWRGAAGALTVVGVTWAVGSATIGPSETSTNALRVAVVQPGIAPAHSWTRGYSERQLAAALAMTAELPPGSVDLVVWPENSVTLYPEREPYVRAVLEAAARRLGADLIVGAPRDTGHGVANSARLVTPDGHWLHYDKQRLVPFAEAPVGFEDATAHPTASPRHFRAGTLPGRLAGRAPLGVSICHELLYPETIHPAVAAGATVLVNIANDGWLDGGYGVASRQHFAMGVLRAVEARRHLVRAAVGGVSGIVDPYGRMVSRSDPGASGIVRDDVLPRADVTPYVRFGDWFSGVCGLFACLLLARQAAPIRLRRRVPVPHPV